MKKIFKVIGLVVLGLVLILGGWLGLVALGGLPVYDVKQVDLRVESSPARVEHGRKMATMLCIQCHLDPGTKKVSGTEMKDLPAVFGVAYSKNITNHPTKGIGGWTDGQLAFLMRTGIHPKSGSYVPPWMPKFLHMSDEDMASIIAWLRSDDPLVAASDADNRESSPSFMAKFLSRVAFMPFDYPTAPIPQPDTTNLLAFGKYVAINYDCFTCHSGDFAKMDLKTPENSFDFFGGGNRMPDINGVDVTTSNITPDNETGIGKWTEAQFVHAMRTGIKPDGTILKYPMRRLSPLTDHELRAAYAYLRTVPAINKPETPNDVYADAASGSRGRQLFHKYECVRCHSTSGSGVANLLAANDKYPEDSTLVDVIYNNERYHPDSYMPLFAGHISSEDALVLAAYVRELGKKKGA